MKRKVDNILPTKERILHIKGCSFLSSFIHNNSQLFINRRRPVALGFAIGMSLGVIPLPSQVFVSLIFSYFLRANIPASIFAAFIINPLTYPLIIGIILSMGSLFGTPTYHSTMAPISLILSDFTAWFSQSEHYFNSLGKTFILGMLITMLIFFAFFYLLVFYSWHIAVIKERHKRLKQYKLNSSTIHIQ